jgi:hypothetical protein
MPGSGQPGSIPRPAFKKEDLMNENDPGAEAASWDASYAGGRPPWDLSGPPAALTRLIESMDPTPLRVLVPCSGNGHDAIAWAQAGHQVVAVDFAPRAVAGAQDGAARAGVALEILQADLFQIKQEFRGSFDLVWEQTCLAALDPARREGYFETMAAVLGSAGLFIGLLWNHGRVGGPPYDISVDLVRQVATAWFVLENWHWVQNSTPSRSDEFLVWLRKKP